MLNLFSKQRVYAEDLNPMRDSRHAGPPLDEEAIDAVFVPLAQGRVEKVSLKDIEVVE